MPEDGTPLIHAHLAGAHSETPEEGCPGCAPRPISAVEPRPRRVDEAAPSGRLCGCGCGRPVRRRFLPGHDAKLKSELLARARAGDEAARKDLIERGWGKFL